MRSIATLLVLFGFIVCAKAQQPQPPQQQFSQDDVTSILVHERAEAYAFSAHALKACQQGGAALKQENERLKNENDKLKAEIASLRAAATPPAAGPDKK